MCPELFAKKPYYIYHADLHATMKCLYIILHLNIPFNDV